MFFMDHQDTLRLLRECDAGAKMGVASIDGVLENVKNQQLHDLLSASRERHEQLGNRTAQLLDTLGEAGKEPPAMAKGMAAMKSGMKMMLGNPDQQAADLICDGCGMGVKSLSRYLNQYPNAQPQAQKVARELIAEEEGLEQAVRPFL